MWGSLKNSISSTLKIMRICTNIRKCVIGWGVGGVLGWLTIIIGRYFWGFGDWDAYILHISQPNITGQHSGKWLTKTFFYFRGVGFRDDKGFPVVTWEGWLKCVLSYLKKYINRCVNELCLGLNHLVDIILQIVKIAHLTDYLWAG